MLTPEEAAKQPFGLVRTLRSVQDQIAQGSASAHEFQKRFLAELNTEMRNMPSETWDDPRNARAAVIFVLSGGDPRLANDLLGRTPLPPVDERLLKAALAFGEGRAQDAVQFFEEINVRSLEPGLAGLVALIYGTLIGKKEAKKADRALRRRAPALARNAGRGVGACARRFCLSPAKGTSKNSTG